MEVRVLSPALAAVALFAVVTPIAAAPGWRVARPIPIARTEVSGARVGSEIVVAGGYLADGTSTGRVDAYSPRGDRWRQLPALPVRLNHAAAAAAEGRLYVAGGYGAERKLFVFAGGAWRRLRDLPVPRAAAAAAIVDRRLYVVGGVTAPGQLAKRMLVFDLVRGRWSFAAGPTPREHLAAAASAGRVFALAGRSGGTNFGYLEAYSPGRRTWGRLPPVPDPRGGTGLAANGGRLVSVGGEEAAGTIAPVYSYDVGRRSWTRLADMRTPRHGLAVAAFGARVYAIAGGPQPGLHVSNANEYLVAR